eukprot:Gb_22284 [translate_table: standard]
MMRKHMEVYPQIKHVEYFDVGIAAKRFFCEPSLNIKNGTKQHLTNFELGHMDISRIAAWSLRMNHCKSPRMHKTKKTYHGGKIWIDNVVDISMDQIELLTGLRVDLQRDIESAMGTTKKMWDDKMKTELGDGDKLIINSKCIVINWITNPSRKWVGKIFNTWFCNSGRMTNIPKSWSWMIKIVTDQGTGYPWVAFVEE